MGAPPDGIIGQVGVVWGEGHSQVALLVRWV